MFHFSHHLKAYVVFLTLSICSVGLLAYLYTPFTLSSPQRIGSEVLTVSGEETVSAEVIVMEDSDADMTTTRRIRFTNLLLRHQKELAELEAPSVLSSPELSQKIQTLRTRIENLENIITELTQ